MTLQAHVPDPIVSNLLAWYPEHRRELPWRNSSDPYAVWVSEIMLQQTRVDTVIPYFQAWMERFPRVQDLAAAHIDEVLEYWQGLGYYSRARNIHRCANEVVATYEGELPDQVNLLRKLPGIGPYTAGAVASIAFGKQAALVDGNVIRVLARLFDVSLDMSKSAGPKEIWRIAEELVPSELPGDFNQSLMELGATVCHPRSPECARCPVAEFCLARAAGVQSERPVKTKKQKQRREEVHGWVLVDPEGRVLVAQRPNEGLLGGLWEYPLLVDLDAVPLPPSSQVCSCSEVEHIFSHIRLRVRLSTAKVPPDFELRESAKTWSPYARQAWVHPSALEALPLSRLMEKMVASWSASVD